MAILHDTFWQVTGHNEKECKLLAVFRHKVEADNYLDWACVEYEDKYIIGLKELSGIAV
jgi:hypothetical protein